MDGLGWLITKRARLMRAYGWSPDYVRKGITGAQGWVWYNWALENEASVWGVWLERTTPGYVKQEYQKRLKALRKE